MVPAEGEWRAEKREPYGIRVERCGGRLRRRADKRSIVAEAIAHEKKRATHPALSACYLRRLRHRAPHLRPVRPGAANAPTDPIGRLLARDSLRPRGELQCGPSAVLRDGPQAPHPVPPSQTPRESAP